MKNKYPIILTTIAAGFLAVIVYFLYLQGRPFVQAKPVHIAIINAAKIKKDSKTFKQFQENADDKLTNLRQIILEKEGTFRTEYETLQNVIKNAKKNEKHIDELKKDFQKKINDFEHELQQRKEKLSEEIAHDRDDLEKKLANVIEKIAKNNHFNLVLNSFVDEKKLVMYADEAFDITDLVIKNLDESLEK